MQDMPVVIKNASTASCGDAMLDAGVRVNFFRKGVVGDWTNYFSDEQLARLDARVMEKFGGTGLEHLWTY